MYGEGEEPAPRMTMTVRHTDVESDGGKMLLDTHEIRNEDKK